MTMIQVGIIAVAIFAEFSSFAEEKTNVLKITVVGIAKEKPNEMTINLNANAIKNAEAKAVLFEKSGIKLGKLLGVKYGENLICNESNPWQYLCTTQAAELDQDKISSITPKTVIAKEKLILIYQIN